MTQPQAGWAAVDPFTNQVTFTAPAYWAGTTTITYEVCSTSGECATGSVAVTIAA
ncbi:MAG: Ig-like domain-containing protein [Dehalococcoidia bacterium]